MDRPRNRALKGNPASVGWEERETEEERERGGEISGKSNKEREVNRMMGR